MAKIGDHEAHDLSVRISAAGDGATRFRVRNIPGRSVEHNVRNIKRAALPGDTVTTKITKR